jgi:hypothetical protein
MRVRLVVARLLLSPLAKQKSPADGEAFSFLIYIFSISG